MGFFSAIQDWLSAILDKKVKEEFRVESVSSAKLDGYLDRCMQIYMGSPPWLDPDNHISTINFAETICSEVARLATMNATITITGSARADWLQAETDKTVDWMRDWCELGCAAGTIILKPNGDTVDLVLPDRFRIVKADGGAITGVVFIDRKKDPDRERWYTRLEYHRIENGVYQVSNRYFEGESKYSSGLPVAMERTPWVDDALADDMIVEGANRLLFGIFRTPRANNKDPGSRLGLPIFSSALEELKDLDVAYSRNAKEIEDSRRLTIIDSDRLLPIGGGKTGQINKDVLVSSAGFPDYIKAVEGTGMADKEVYHEINPSLNTEARLKGINSLLSQIGFKCGFSNGYFVFNEKTGMVTATQVESDDRRTLQLVEDVRKALKACLDGLIYAMDKFADGYGLAPHGRYEVAYGFDDLTLNTDEDRTRWWGYVLQGKVPFWVYLVKYEGYTEEDAKELEAMAQTPEPALSAEE